MDKRTVSIVGIVLTVLLCGLPGLCGLFAGPLFAVIGLIPGANIDMFGSSDPASAITFGITTLCVSVILVAIPIALAFFTFRKKKDESGVIDVVAGPDDFA